MIQNHAPGTQAASLARLGVLTYEPPNDPSSVLKAVSNRLAIQGLRVAGLLQRLGDRPPSGGKRSLWIDDIGTGETLRLDKPRGPGARDCVMDPAALAEAATWLRRGIEACPQVVLVNRFGHAEAEGGGLRTEISEAILSGAVVLIAVRRALLPDLEEFLGEPAVQLPFDPDAIAAWAEHLASDRREARNAQHSRFGA